MISQTTDTSPWGYTYNMKETAEYHTTTTSDRFLWLPEKSRTPKFSTPKPL